MMHIRARLEEVLGTTSNTLPIQILAVSELMDVLPPWMYGHWGCDLGLKDNSNVLSHPMSKYTLYMFPQTRLVRK